MTTTADGAFRIPLLPGVYSLVAVNLKGSAYPRSQPVTVTVTAGRFTSVVVSFDSGIQ